MGAALAGALVWRGTPTPESPCERAYAAGDWPSAVERCAASYEQAGNDRDGVRAARAALQLGDRELDRAEQLARRLVTGASRGDAHTVLSYLALMHGAVHEARLHAMVAFVAHTLSGDRRALAGDALSLSQAAWKAGDFAAALGAADQALAAAERLRDRPLAWSAHMARADALRRIGDTRGALDALTRASALAVTPCEQAWAQLKQGMGQMEDGQDGLSMLDLTLAAQAAERCPDRFVSTSIHLNQAWLQRRRSPAAAAASLDALPDTEQQDPEVLLLRGYLAAGRGDLVAAGHYLAAAESHDPLDADWPWEIARTRAELCEQIGGPLGDLLAAYHYRRAIAMVAALRVTARAGAAYLVASHRAPYEGLIALLARHGRWRDALAVVLQLDASDMLRATAASREGRGPGPPDVAAVAGPATSAPATVDDVIAAWRGRDLVVVVAASPREVGSGHERAYRLRITGGRVTGDDVGDAGAARRWADDLFADPGNRDAARGLGRLFVRDGPAGDPLYVLAIGPLGKVPLAALRTPGGPLAVALRPLVRVLALRVSGVEAAGGGPPVVLADPRGDLPGAAVEGAMAAGALGAAAQIAGSRAPVAATRARLWAARDAAVLHVAAHVRAVGRGRVLQLADGDVEPAEIVQRGIAPRIAVLADCGSAAATDEEGWGSIAAALLEAGTAVVIATDRSVRDADALSVMRRFYAQPGWRTDPARALAQVQTALDAQGAPPGSWAAFSVLGRPPPVP